VELKLRQDFAWTPVANLAAYIITIKPVQLDGSLEARLPASAATFSVPDGFLLPGTEYQLAIGTESAISLSSGSRSSWVPKA
jgi:hypothetical protein